MPGAGAVRLVAEAHFAHNGGIMKDRTVGFLGAGNMAGALIKGLLHAGVVDAKKIIASDVKAIHCRRVMPARRYIMAHPDGNRPASR